MAIYIYIHTRVCDHNFSMGKMDWVSVFLQVHYDLVVYYQKVCFQEKKKKKQKGEKDKSKYN